MILQDQLKALDANRKAPMLYRIYRIVRFATGFRVRNMATADEEYFYGSAAAARYLRRRG